MSDTSPPLYGLILAGGSGTRFWPLSRHRKPKHLLRLFDEETLLEKAVNRLDGLIPRENILVLTNIDQAAAVRELLPDLPPENILAEPDKRDTAPAVALGVGAVARRSSEATMVVLPADQVIRDEAGFREILRSAGEAARLGDAIVTLGIKPTWACPGYGYIERGSRANILGYEGEHRVFEVERFREKPDPELAARFLETGNYTWNGGIFVWSLPTIVREFSENCPELADFISDLRRTSDFDATVRAQFPELTRNSFDYAIMEKAGRVFNIEADVGWDDVGSWVSVAKYLDQDAAGNATRGPATLLDSSGNIVFSGSGGHIALLGVHDLVVVQTEDGFLVADRDVVDEIKKVVEKLPDDLK